jgi:hypothetical protein
MRRQAADTDGPSTRRRAASAAIILVNQVIIQPKRSVRG